MTIFRHILVGLDLESDGRLSEGSRRAVEHARWLAAGRAVQVTLVHSTRADERWDAERARYVPSGGPLPSEAPGGIDAARSELAEAGVATGVEITEDPAWLALARTALSAPADLVLAAKRSRAPSDGRTLGSVATKLLRKCPTPVWLVKVDTPPPPRKLLAASDGADVGRSVVDLAAKLAKESGASLDVVHALQLPMTVQLAGDEAIARWHEQERARASEEIASQAEAAGLAEAKCHVGLTSPTHAVLEGARVCEADLVVMGTIARGGIAGLLLGNTAERLLGRLNVPLLVLKPADFVCPITLDD